MTTIAWAILGLMLVSVPVLAASVRIENPAVAEAYLDKLFAVSGCRMTFAEIDNRMRLDGLIPTEAEMASDVGVAKFIRQRRVMTALEALFSSGQIISPNNDHSLAISKFGGCA